MRQIWIPVAATLAIAACTAGTKEERIEDLAAAWRHEDGTAVTVTDYAQARLACERSSQRTPATADVGIAENPAYHPGGAGLMGAPPGSAFLGRVNSPNSTRVAQGAIPLADCLKSKGFVRADTG